MMFCVAEYECCVVKGSMVVPCLREKRTSRHLNELLFWHTDIWKEPSGYAPTLCTPVIFDGTIFRATFNGLQLDQIRAPLDV